MGFRDDNEALRARAALAEQRAGQAEDERERLNRELAEARANDESDAKRIAQLEKRLAKLEPSARASKKSAGSQKAGAAIAAAGALLVLGGVAAFMLLGANENSRPSVMAVEVPPEPVAALVPAPVVEVSALERVRLAGVVRSVDGVEGLEPGAGCIADRGLGQRGFETLQVRCGTAGGVVTVFDGAADTGGGVEQSSGNVRESIALSGGVVRSMAYSLTGQWSGPQAQIQLDPTQRALRVWRSGLGANDLLVHLESSAGSVGELTGTGTTGENTNPFGRGTLARLELRGAAPAVLGELDTENCVLRTVPIRSGHLTGRFLVRCGDRILYGAGQSGWIPAPASGEIAGPVEDADMSPADTDPAMTYTVDTITLVEPEWRLMFDVRPHPSCSLASGTWVGSLRGTDDLLQAGVRLEEGTLTLPDERVLEGEEEMRCHEGVARWASADGESILEGRFGPYFATFVGRLGSGELLELYRTP